MRRLIASSRRLPPRGKPTTRQRKERPASELPRRTALSCFRRLSEASVAPDEPRGLAGTCESVWSNSCGGKGPNQRRQLLCRTRQRSRCVPSYHFCVLSFVYIALTASHNLGSTSSRDNSTTNANSRLPIRTSSREPPSTEDPRRSRPASAQGAEDTLTTEEEPRKKRSLLSIPHSSSQTHEDSTPTGTGLSGATVADSSESIGRGSKRSLTGKRRAGSTASSKHSQQRPATSEKPPQPAPVAEQPEGSTHSKSKKKGGFFSFLSCCGLPTGGTLVDQEENTEANKKTSKLRTGRSPQPTPLKNHDASAAESSTADSKEPMDEKTGDAVYGGDKQNEKPIQGDATMDKPASDVPATSPRIVTRTSSSRKKSTDQPLPPLPNQPGRLDTGSAANPQVTVQAPTPVVTQEEEQVVHDRTPEQEQRDTDIEMTDAPPSLPISANETHTAGEETASQSVQRDSAPVKIDLPPPPPLVERQEQTRTSTGATPQNQSQETSLAVTPAETQKWLLPPIKPEFKGKKCLVLDLDETLVHSSFKVTHLS